MTKQAKYGILNSLSPFPGRNRQGRGVACDTKAPTLLCRRSAASEAVPLSFPTQKKLATALRAASTLDSSALRATLSMHTETGRDGSAHLSGRFSMCRLVEWSGGQRR